MKKYFVIFAVLFASLTMYGAWRIPDILVFRTNSQGNVYLPTFFPASDRSRLKFNDDSNNIKKDLTVIDKSFLDGSGVSPVMRKKNFAIYQPSASSDFCRNYKRICISGSHGILILVSEDKNDNMVTSSYSLLNESTTSLSKLRHLVGMGASSQRLFIVRLGENGDIKESSFNNGVFDLNLNEYRKISFPFIVYSFLLSLSLMFLIKILLKDKTIEFFKGVLRENKTELFILFFWTFLVYLLVFPFLPRGDTVIEAANSQTYTDWYSGMYYIYTCMIRIVGFQWIQIPEIVLVLCSIVIVLRIFGMSIPTKKELKRKFYYILIVLLFILSPEIFIVTFVQQRYFLVLNVVFFGICLWYYFYLYFLSTNGKSYPFSPLYIVGIFGIAWLLRPEYFSIFVLSSLFFVAFWFILKKSKSSGSIFKIFVVFSCVIFVKFFICYFMPYAYNYDSKVSSFRYKAISALHMGYPYLCPKVKDTKLQHTIEYFGSLETYCEIKPEMFWWRNVDPKANYGISPKEVEMEKYVYNNIMNNTKDFVVYSARTGYFILYYSKWKSVSNSEKLNNILHIHSKEHYENFYLDHYEEINDSFGLIHNNIVSGKMSEKLVYFYNKTNRHFSFYSFCEIIFLLIIMLIYGWSWLSIILSFLFLFLVVVISFLVPTEQWGYMAFIPVWGTFLPPLALAETLITRRYFREHAPTGWLATLFLRVQAFFRFAALSGGCWAIDLTLLFVLHHLAHLPLFVSNMLSSSLAAGTVFLVSSRLIHNGRQSHGKKRVVAYLAYNFVVIAAASIILPALTKWVMGTGASELVGGYGFLLAKIILTPPQLVLNFFVSRFVSRYNV